MFHRDEPHGFGRITCSDGGGGIIATAGRIIKQCPQHNHNRNETYDSHIFSPNRPVKNQTKRNYIILSVFGQTTRDVVSRLKPSFKDLYGSLRGSTHISLK